MFRSCITVNIPLVTGHKLNCFISGREMLLVIFSCALLLFFYFLFLHVFIFSGKKQEQISVVIYNVEYYLYMLIDLITNTMQLLQ